MGVREVSGCVSRKRSEDDEPRSALRHRLHAIKAEGSREVSTAVPESPGVGPVVVYAVTSHLSAKAFLSGQLAYLASRGFRVVLMCDDAHLLTDSAREEGFEVADVPMSRDISLLADMQSLVRVALRLLRVKPDAVVYGTPKAALLFALAAKLLRVQKRVFVMHGLRSETLLGNKAVLLRSIDRLVLRLSTVTVCVSPSLRARAMELGLHRARDGLVLRAGTCNGIDVSRYVSTPERRTQAQRIHEELGIPAGTVVFGFIGRLVRDKGVADLVSVFLRQVLPIQPSSWLLLIGDTEESDSLPISVLDLIRSHPRISWLTYRLLDGHYQAMDVLVLPTYREGFPLVPLEASAASIPVVTTQATGARDSVVDRVTGILVPAGDHDALGRAMLELARSPSLRSELGENGRQWVAENFQQLPIWQAYEELLSVGHGGLFDS